MCLQGKVLFPEQFNLYAGELFWGPGDVVQIRGREKFNAIFAYSVEQALHSEKGIT